MDRANGARIRVEGLQPAQVLAGLVAVVFLVFGIIGFTKTGFGDFAGHHDAGFWRFSANPMNNLVHVVTGLLGLALAFGSGRARVFGWLLFLGYGVLFVWGLMITGTITTNPFANAGNPLDLTAADNWLHLGIAALGLFIAVLPARRRVRIPEEPVDPGVPTRADTVHSADTIGSADTVRSADTVGPVDTAADPTVRTGDPVVHDSGAVRGPRATQETGAGVREPAAAPLDNPVAAPAPREKRGPGLAH
ncbi:DUF4383 domain-containing protein [Amycolatopsis sp. PS_44_ISF1]|uniref:DUF4383 domain-containing protein n=1 Tax=Amycolatopsis sp. PS_44_ISF1 TaxID=2974917 RepID=UPI0028DEBDA4|nr:DUF4383 domain-containing protein [Amycolatopsis sp. PS_44_ISF1]MDT8910174.1 DUF4383 domain-containing protein [Amycolatopsis sp. PS_44_ISF1]